MTADLPLSRDPVPERSSHLDIGRGMPSPQERSQSVQVRKRTSVKRKASHMWKSLSRNARLNHKDDSIDDGATNTYQSFENLDDCFHLDEDCDCSSHDQKRRHRDAKVPCAAVHICVRRFWHQLRITNTFPGGGNFWCQKSERLASILCGGR